MMKDHAFLTGAIWGVMIAMGFFTFLLGVFYTRASGSYYPGLPMAFLGVGAFTFGVRRTIRTIRKIRRLRAKRIL
jgi:hypothetical protein